MPWYRSGTVAVTNGSPNVVGTSTTWVSEAKAGYGFRGPDGNLYEILTVVSDTSMTLAENYTGSTASGQAHAIVPTQGYAQTVAALLEQLLADFTTIATSGAGIGRFGAGTVSAPGVAATGDTDTGVFWPAANAIAIALGGTEAARFVGGSLGVGVTAPSHRLHVNNASGSVTGRFSSPNVGVDVRCDEAVSRGVVGTYSNHALALHTNGAERVHITTGGSVGIGLPGAPAHRLDVSDDTTGIVTARVVNTNVGASAGTRLRLENTTTPWDIESSRATSSALVFARGASEFARIDASGNLIHEAPAVVPSLARNQSIVMNLTSNTNLRISARGSDGTTRVVNLTLA